MPTLSPQSRSRRVKAIFEKMGELGGVGQDKDFEAAFSNLAHAYMREKAPSLEPYEVGFELLERSDDGKRAVGITGYQVGDQLFYCPVFWLAGKIKGHELLFLKDQSLFVPLKENWINYMLERKLPEIGKSVKRDPLRLGIRRPDILRQTRSGLKYAAMDMLHDLGTMPPAMPAQPQMSPPQNPLGQQPMAPMPQAPQPQMMGQPQFQLPEMGGQPPQMPGMSPEMPPQQMPNPLAMQAPETQQAAMPAQVDPMASDVDVADGGDADGLEMGSAAGGLPIPAKMAALRAMAELPDMDVISLPEFIRYVGKRAFLEFGKILHAAPKIAKMAFDIHGQSLLDALRDAEHYEPPTQAQCDRFHSQLKAALNQTEAELEISDDGDTVTDRRPAESASKIYADALNVTLFNPSVSGVYDIVLRYGRIAKCFVSVNPRRDFGHRYAANVITMESKGPQSFRSVRTLDQLWAVKDHGMQAWTEYAKDLPTASSLDTASGPQVILVSQNGESIGPYRVGKVIAEHDGQTTYLTDNGTEVTIDAGESKYFRMLQERIFAPAKAHVVACKEYTGDELSLGEPAEVNREAFAGFAKLSAFQEGNSVTVVSDLGRHTVKKGRDAMLLLMKGHGLDETGCRLVLKHAEIRRDPIKLRIKYGDNAYLATKDRVGPMDDVPNDYGSYDMQSGESVPESERQFVNSPVDIPPTLMRPAEKAHYVTPDQGNAFQEAEQAGEQGQQQAFDAGVLTSMLRNMRDDQLIDRFIPALSRAMDASGRLLYQFYWHQEDFAERYGDKDMPDLGDSLRNIFEGLGDIVLKLKQKTVDPYPEEQNLGVSLTDLAGAS